MTVMTSPRVITWLMSVCLLACHVHGHTPSHRQPSDVATEEEGEGGGGGHPHPHHTLQQQSRSAQQGEGGCEEGWLHTHRHCLLDTGLGEGEEARALCAHHGAEEARGVCLKQESPVSDLTSSTQDEEEEEEEEEEEGVSQTAYECPSGWTRYGHFCFFRPATVPRICGLVGASYIFNYCFTRVPHKVPVDFVQAVKRLEGSDYHLHRDTRLCCCGGGRNFC